MKWFKHLLGSEEGDSLFVTDLILEFGGDGYYVFYRTLEIMCVEFNVKNPAENQFAFEYFYRKFLRISRNKLKKILIRCSEKYQESNGENGIYFQENEKSILLKCCKLKILTDNYTNKCLTNVGQMSVETTNKDPTNVGRDYEQMSDKCTNKLPTDVGHIELELELELDKEKSNYIPVRGKAALDDIPEYSLKKLIDEIEKMSSGLYEEKIFPDVYAFKNKAAKNKINPKAVLRALIQCGKNKPSDPWGYCTKILQVEDGNYNANDFIRTAL
jgi:hypothetical protein